MTAPTMTDPRDRRLSFPALLEMCGLNRPDASGVEVGVQRGEFAKACLARYVGKWAFVDPWIRWPDDIYPDPTNKEHPEQNYQAALGVARLYSERVRIVRKTSLEACEDFADKSLDWVYIDANHTHLHVLEDLAIWTPRVKPGGIVAGHDFVEKADRPDIEVVRAVLETFPDRRIGLIDEAWPSFWVVV